MGEFLANCGLSLGFPGKRDPSDKHLAWELSFNYCICLIQFKSGFIPLTCKTKRSGSKAWGVSDLVIEARS